jgi:hypothetical protein
MATTSSSDSSSQVTSATALAALQTFYKNFVSNNQQVIGTDVTSTNTSSTNLTSTLQTVRTNNINAINTLLTSLMGSEAAQAATQSALTTSSTVNPVLPTYNTRVPYTEIYLNGAKAVPLIPQANVSGVDISPDNYFNSLQIEVLFEDLELSMPMGGVNNTITGTLKLFSRTPIELLAFITDGLNDQSSDISDTTPGLPVCEIKVGWNIADGTTTGTQIRSPMMSFLVTNIQMTDPGKTMGSEFTLTLQDAGSACLQNSSATLGILSDYPQEQLRLLIEKVIGLRLFTLDDLLQLGSNSSNTSSGISTSSSTSSQYYNETFFVNPQSAPLRINSNNLENAINELLEYIYCRWYPVNNANLNTAISDASSAAANITALRQQFKNDSSIQKISDITQLNSNAVKLANCCILIWVPYFPANIYTSSNNAYLQSSDLTDTGAFVMLPKYTEDISIMAANLPVIYGPGGSSIPYFYGGGENVFQRLAQINNSYGASGISNTVGEVLDLTLNFNDYIAVMKNNYDEEVFARQDGVPINATNGTVKLSLNKVSSSSQSALTTATIIKKLQGLGINTANVTPEQALEIWRTSLMKKFKVIKGRFKKGLADRKLYAGDSDAILTAGVGANKSYFNANNIYKFSYDKLSERLGTFLQYPLTIGMTVLGDPYLLRQGIGVFEIINYYPTSDGVSFKFNPMVSGVYFPQTVIHRISLGDYTTEIRAVKVPNDVSNTATQSYSSILTSSSSTTTSDNYTSLIDDIMTVNLESLSSQGNSKLTVPATNTSSYSSTTQSQAQVLTSTLLTGSLKTQMDAAFAEFASLNSAVQNPTTSSNTTTTSTNGTTTTTTTAGASVTTTTTTSNGTTINTGTSS